MSNVRKPDNVHLLNGTYDASRHGSLSDKPDWSTELPEMPDYLDELAQAEWNKTMRDAPAGVLTKTDSVILAQYCLMVSKMIRSTHKPEVIDGEAMPGVVFLAADHTQLRLIQQELGFTPISRGKIGGTPKKHNDKGPQSIPR